MARDANVGSDFPLPAKSSIVRAGLTTPAILLQWPHA